MSTNQSPLKIIRDNQLEKEHVALSTENFSVQIKNTLILNKINVTVKKNRINCIIGPSGAGKSTLIRSFNRINDEVDSLQIYGNIRFNGNDIYDNRMDVSELRSRIGMVFQKPAVFPVSIRENVLMGVRHHRKLSRLEELEIIEKNLKAVSLWKEVSHRLDKKAASLSVGQQQRLCIARTLAVEPEVILLDEPTSALDPVSSKSIEELMVQMKEDYSIVFVTHNIPQARRIADELIFICDGELIECGPKEQLFKTPEKEATKKYLREDLCDC